MLDESINRGKLVLLPEISGIQENKSRVIEKIIDYITLISKYATRMKESKKIAIIMYHSSRFVYKKIILCSIVTHCFFFFIEIKLK